MHGTVQKRKLVRGVVETPDVPTVGEMPIVK